MIQKCLGIQNSNSDGLGFHNFWYFSEFFWTVNYQFHKVTVIESLLTMSYSGTIIVIWKIESVQIDGSYIHQKFFLHLTHFRVKFWWPPGWGQFYEKSYLGSPEHGFGKCWSFQLRSILSNWNDTGATVWHFQQNHDFGLFYINLYGSDSLAHRCRCLHNS